MAKQIKVIKCPNCGSIQKDEIKPEHYQCNNCQTEYFLDNDDINININNQQNTPNQINIFANNSIWKIVGAAIAIIIVIVLMSSLFNQKPTVQQPPRTVNQTTNNNLTVKQNPTQTITKKIYQTYFRFCTTILVDNHPYILAIEEQSYSVDDYQFYFTLYDLIENKKIKETKLDKFIRNKYGSIRIEHLDFSESKTFFVVNDKTVFLLDKMHYTLTDVTSSLLTNHPAYQTGIASVSLSQTTSGHALHILTNDGKKIYYYPLIDEVYLDDYDFHMVKNRPKRPPADTSIHTVFDFTDDYYGQDYKLIKYSYISPDGKDHIEPRTAKIGSYKQDGTRTKHTDADSAYDLINRSNYNIQITDHKNLTPGRLYFEPSIIYFDDNFLIIKTKVNAAPDADYNYQQIDINDGKVIWTLSDDNITIEEISPYRDSFIAKQDCSHYAVIDKNGNIIQKITFTKK